MLFIIIVYIFHYFAVEAVLDAVPDESLKTEIRKFLQQFDFTKNLGLSLARYLRNNNVEECLSFELAEDISAKYEECYRKV